MCFLTTLNGMSHMNMEIILKNPTNEEVTIAVYV